MTKGKPYYDEFTVPYPFNRHDMCV